MTVTTSDSRKSQPGGNNNNSTSQSRKNTDPLENTTIEIRSAQRRKASASKQADSPHKLETITSFASLHANNLPKTHQQQSAAGEGGARDITSSDDVIINRQSPVLDPENVYICDDGPSASHLGGSKPPTPSSTMKTNSGSTATGGASPTGRPPMMGRMADAPQDVSLDVLGNGVHGQPHTAFSSYHSTTTSRPGSSTQGAVVLSVEGNTSREATSTNANSKPLQHGEDSASDVSTITGHFYDQELVEELHHALNEMRAELEESRAEAARAVKVAEQAIQSAERSNSAEWQNTVTHKAAEAAAQAQKRSAEAMARQRLAEDRLEQEKRTAAFWRKQAEIAEEEAGALQTRAAAAEVQRATMEGQLESERRSFARPATKETDV
jgi:hypothetical protein